MNGENFIPQKNKKKGSICLPSPFFLASKQLFLFVLFFFFRNFEERFSRGRVVFKFFFLSNYHMNLIRLLQS